MGSGLKVRRGGSGGRVAPLWLPEPISPGQKQLSSSRDQRESVEVLSKGLARPHSQNLPWAVRNVQGVPGCILGRPVSKSRPSLETEARDNESRY